MITIAQLRTQISDIPRQYPRLPEICDTIGVGDGARTQFSLRYPNYETATLIVFFGTVPTAPGTTSWVAQSASSYTATGQQIVFNTAPAAGTLIGSAYQATAFADSDLQTYLTNAQALQSTDQMVLKQAQYDITDVLLGNHELLRMIKEGDYQRDPKSVVAGLIALKEQLRMDLTGNPQPGAAIPAATTFTTTYHRYEVPR